MMIFHQPIVHDLYVDFGLHLHRMNSDILEKLLLHFTKKEIDTSLVVEEMLDPLCGDDHT